MSFIQSQQKISSPLDERQIFISIHTGYSMWTENFASFEWYFGSILRFYGVQVVNLSYLHSTLFMHYKYKVCIYSNEVEFIFHQKETGVLDNFMQSANSWVNIKFMPCFSRFDNFLLYKDLILEILVVQRPWLFKIFQPLLVQMFWNDGFHLVRFLTKFEFQKCIEQIYRWWLVASSADRLGRILNLVQGIKIRGCTDIKFHFIIVRKCMFYPVMPLVWWLSWLGRKFKQGLLINSRKFIDLKTVWKRTK